MSWSILPQAIAIASMVVSIHVALSRYGQPKKPDTYDLTDVLIGPAISVTLLYYGGFFAAIGWAP